MSRHGEERSPKRRNVTPDIDKAKSEIEIDETTLEHGGDGVTQSSDSSKYQQHSPRPTVTDSLAPDEEDEEETTSSCGTDSSEEADQTEGEEGDDDEDAEEESGEGLTIDEIGILAAASPQSTSSLPPNGDRSDLKSRLQSFLPRLQKANVELETSTDILERRVDYVTDDAQQYIEMNLGLGVLSEQRPGEDDEVRLDRSSSEEAEDRADDEDLEPVDHPGEDVLARLKGQKVRRGSKRKVQELG